MAAVKELKNKIELTDTELKEARFFCGDFTGRNNRNRAVSNILGIKIAKKFFKENGIQADDKFSAYKIKKILEDFDIADIRVDGKIVDVRAVFNENMLFIPKSHYDYGITPAYYMFVKINKDLETGEVLGFLDPLMVEDSKSSLEYYFPEKENLISVKMFKQKFKKIPYTEYPLKNTKEARRDIVRYYDNTLENKTRFIKLVVNNEDVRKAMLEFENAEDLFSNISDDFKNYDETAVVDEVSDEDYPEDDFYDNNDADKKIDFSEEYIHVEPFDDDVKVTEEKIEEMAEDTVSDYVSPDFSQVTDNEIEEEEREISFDSDEINDVSENLVSEEPDSETIDYLDPENSDIEIKREAPVLDSPVDFETGNNEIYEEPAEVNENAFSTEETLSFSDTEETVIDEEPPKEPEVIDNFLILDFDTDIRINDKTPQNLDEPHKMNAEAISNAITEDMPDEDIHILENDLPKLKEELTKDEGEVDPAKISKKVETDLDKLFKSGSAQESEEFEEEGNEEDYIIEEQPENISEPEKIEDTTEDELPKPDLNFPELEELDNSLKENADAKPKGKRKIRRIIILTVGTAFIVSAITAGVTAFLFNNVDVERFDENPANKVRVKEIPLNPEPQTPSDMPLEGLGSLDLPKDTGKEFYVLPPSTTDLEPNGFDIKNIDISWDVPEICIDTPEKKNALLTVGRKIKLALSNDLLLTDEKPKQKNLIINMVVNDKSMKAGSVQATSGSRTIDKLVIQAINDVLKNSKLTLEGLNKETGYPSIIISF